MHIRQLDSDIYILTGDTYNSNSTVLVNGQTVLLIDAMAGREDAQALRRFVEAELKKNVRFIICTHYFSDHLAALQLFPEAQIIAHKNYYHTFASEDYRTEEEKKYFVEPTILISSVVVSNGITMKWGRYTLDIFYNPGHTMSTLNVDIPEADLLIASDQAVGNIVYMHYSPPEMIAAALKRLQKRERGCLVEGHGEVMGMQAIDNALHYLGRLEESVRSMRRSGQGDEAIRGIDLTSCLPQDVRGSSFEALFHQRNLEAIINRNFFSTN